MGRGRPPLVRDKPPVVVDEAGPSMTQGELRSHVQIDILASLITSYYNRNTPMLIRKKQHPKLLNSFIVVL
ncbi:hypothetical protein L596_005573 [Steinernema carpocapsae]|uniref:Uncharacterized protein n=1 Tax=Steinernema carpocapsae TaxID=34508 RepID=A0A4U8UZF6_STECR|nr:hypothetical protein L596_005573 [Steinernema carpocapsae]